MLLDSGDRVAHGRMFGKYTEVVHSSDVKNIMSNLSGTVSTHWPLPHS